jgi:hypothetical protein
MSIAYYAQSFATWKWRAIKPVVISAFFKNKKPCKARLMVFEADSELNAFCHKPDGGSNFIFATGTTSAHSRHVVKALYRMLQHDIKTLSNSRLPTCIIWYRCA